MEDYVTKQGSKIQWVESGDIEKNGPEQLLADVDGVFDSWRIWVFEGSKGK